ncbi:MAG: ABC transporter substrate-binding protein [bacterium]|nr:ABC transporter substrate-binding protein [bacterium]
MRRDSGSFVRSIAALFLLTLLVLPSAEADDVRPLRIVMPNAPVELDPHVDSTAVGDSFFLNIYESLLSFNSEGTAKPVLATGWHKVNGHGWRFELRQGVRFHDGREMTSADIAASIERARTHPKSKLRELLGNVVRTVAEGSTAVRIDLSGPDAIFLKTLSWIFILPHDAPEKIVNPVGTGPYRVADQEPGRSISLHAFSDYWGFSPHESFVNLVFEADRKAALQRLLSNEADLATDILPASVDWVERRNDLFVDSSLGSMVYYISLNTTKPPFDSSVVREAIDYALNRQRIAEDVFLKYARPAGQLVNDSAYGYAPEIGPVEPDLVRAQALIEVATRSAPIRFELEYKTGNESFARTVKKQLEDAGITVELKALPWGDLLHRFLSGEAQATILAWRSDLSDVGYTYDMLFHSGSPNSPRIGVTDSTIDELIVACRTVTDPGRRLALLYSVSERIAQRRVLLPIVWIMDLYGVRRGIQWQPQASGSIELATISRKVE